MVKIFEEENEREFKGTIIDLETIGDFNRQFKDSRQYKNIIPVIFGFINNQKLKILTAKNHNSLIKLQEKIIEQLERLDKPFYAFNSPFEKGVLFHHLGKKIEFERELNLKKFESKKVAVKLLGIPDYEDPCFGDGLLCSTSWLKGNINKAILHNRSCLLKERDILLKRGFRKPDELVLVE